MTAITHDKQRTVAITGAGRGLGRETALAFAAKGYRVFGTALKPEHIAELERASGGAITLTICDITDEAAVHSWAQSVATQTDGGLDLLVQNAARLTPGPLEVLPLDAIKREFDVNVFAALTVANAFLPALRLNRGRIVYISTWTVALPLPFNGPSGASKAALEVIATIQRAELKPFGVDVVVASPGNMLTSGAAQVAAALQKVSDDFNEEQRKLYDRSFAAFATSLNAMQGGGMAAADAAMRVIEIAEQSPAPIRAAVGDEAEGILRYVDETSAAEQDIHRLEMVGLGPDGLPASAQTSEPERKDHVMLVLVDPNDERALRNKDTLLEMNDLLINKRKYTEAAKHLGPVYIQHKPLLENDLGASRFFEKVTAEHEHARVVIHKIIAVGDYVWAHVNFLNLSTDDPNDTGIAGVDIFKFDEDGRAIEHWDVLQVVGDPTNAAPWYAPNIPVANDNGMF